MKINKSLMTIVAAAVMFAVAAVPVLAASVVTNGSFESGIDPNPFFTTLVPGSTNIDDWEVVSGSIDYIGDYWVASDGDRSIDMSGFNAGTISQTFPTVVGAVYTVMFDMAGNPDGGNPVKSLNVDVGGAVENFIFDTTGFTHLDMGWEQMSFTFTADSTETTLTFASVEDGFFFYGPALDNVSVEQFLPITKDECKKDGWMDFGVFKNQGDCVSYVATGGTNLPTIN